MFASMETLESRSLFSASPVMVAPPPPTMQPAVTIHTLALKNMVGKWKGTVLVTGIHAQPVNVRITAETSSGKLKGTLVSTLDPSIVVKITGKISSNGKVSIVLTGGHSGGAINGTGTGKISGNGKSITLHMIFVQGGMSFPGTLTLKKL